jgi:hypothetical protein
MKRLKRLIVAAHDCSFRRVVLISVPSEAIMRSSASIVVLSTCGSLFLLAACSSEPGPAQSTAGRFKVEVLEHGVDSQMVPEMFSADFDEDGEVDQLTVTDTSLHVLLSGGGEFDYSVGEHPVDPDESATRLNDVVLFSFNRDGRYPSLLLATEHKIPGEWPTVEPTRQLVVYNDSGRLILKSLNAYPLVGQSLDCAWLDFNDLPVCFYASYAGTADMGLSRLIEIDQEGFWQVATASDLLAFRKQVSHYDSPLDPDHPSAREAMANRLGDLKTVDSIIASGWAQAAETYRDSIRAIYWGSADRHSIYCNDLTREFRLPWPVEPSLAYDVQQRPRGRFMDGFMMLSARFTDFNGDELLDLVVVGQHSGVFSAVGHEDGYFAAAGYHGLPDEYVRVSAPPVLEGAKLTVPPCVYHSMQRDQATKPDHVECYDRATEHWYKVELPEGTYWMAWEPVVFWDMNEDGMIDFAARRDDGTWTAFTFVQGQ